MQGLTSFVGGLAKSTNTTITTTTNTNTSSVAMSVMDYQSANFGTGDEGGVSAHKAWFFVPTGTVALAYNISGVAGERPANNCCVVVKYTVLNFESPFGDSTCE